MNITELKNLWKENDFRPSRQMGQNFLIDNNVRDKIINSLSVDGQTVLVEIGPGFGVMTFELASKAGRVIAVEKDGSICRIMGPLFEEKGNINLVRGDMLDIDICGLAPDTSLVVFGNIPYYITTALIEKVIEHRRCVDCAYMVIQDEVARRVVSPPGSKEYGSLSCFVQFYADAQRVFKIKKNSFYPRPQIDSSLLKISLLPEPKVKVADKKLMFDIIHKAFSERRKKIGNSLSRGDFLSMDKSSWSSILAECGIDPSNRAENLSLEDFAKISDAAGAC